MQGVTRFAGQFALLFSLFIIGVLAVQPGVALGGRQGMWGGVQRVQAEEKPVCMKGDFNHPITLSVATLTRGLSLESVVSGVGGIILFPTVDGLCSFYSGVMRWASGQSFVFSTGDLITYNQPTVRKMRDALQPVLGAVLALLFALAGYRVLWGASLWVIPRIILAAIASFAAEPLLRVSIEVNNGLCSLMLAAAVQNRLGEDLVSLFLLGTNPLDFRSINWLGGVIILLMGIGVAFQALVRIGILDVLWVISPLVLLCYADPAWQRWANLWMGAWVACVFVQFLQVVVLCLGAALVGNLGGLVPVGLLVGMAMLFLVMKVPGWLAGGVSHLLAGVPSVYQVMGDAVQKVGQMVIQAARLVV
jgi:hypothetical protein